MASSDTKIDIDITQFQFFKNNNRLNNKVLYNELILDRILGFLPVSDIKICRLVCDTWNSVAELILRKRALVTFSSPKDFPKFTATFQDAETYLYFTAVKLKNVCPSPSNINARSWHVSKIEDFSEEWRSKIKFLYLDNIAVRDVLQYPTFEICTSLQSNLSTLIVHSLTSNTKMAVSLEHLTSLNVLKLYSTTILDIGVHGNKLKPKQIVLSGVIFMQDGRTLPIVYLNDIIDFSIAKDVYILNETHSSTRVTLDMKSPTTLDSLFIQNVAVENFFRATWIINGLLTLTGIPWNDKNQLTCKSLSFHCATLNLSALPPTLESLRLSTLEDINGHKLDIFPRHVPILPNLNFLSLTEERDTEHDTILSLFRNCPKLTDIFYEGHLTTVDLPQAWQMEWPERLPNLDINELPPNALQRIEVGTPHRIIGIGLHDVETLIVSNWKPGNPDLTQVTNRLKLKTLVIDPAKWAKSYGNDNRHFRQLMEAVMDFQRHNAILVYVGPVKLNENTKKCETVLRYLERIDSSVLPIDYGAGKFCNNWFRFEKGLGKTILKLEFDQIRKHANSSVFDKVFS